MIRLTARTVPATLIVLALATAHGAEKPVPGGIQISAAGPFPEVLCGNEKASWKLTGNALDPAFVRTEAIQKSIQWTWSVLQVEANKTSLDPQDKGWHNDPDWSPDPAKSKNIIALSKTAESKTSSKASLDASFVSPGFKRITVQARLSFAGEDGNTYNATNTLQLLVVAVKLEIIIHNGLEGASGGQAITGEDKVKKGAVTVANLNDTNGDEKVDKDQQTVELKGKSTAGRNEIDLMKLVISRPDPDKGGTVKLKVISGEVKLWEKPIKQTEIKLNKDKVVEFKTDDLKDQPKSVWVEAIAPSKTVGDIVLEADYMGCKDRVKATAVWARLTRVFRTRAKDGKDNEIPADLVKEELRKGIGTGERSNTAADGSYYGIGPFAKRNIGTEEKPILVDRRIGGRILFEWEVGPKGVENLGVVFDVTRQAFANNYAIGEGTGRLVPDDTINKKVFPEDKNKDIETPNDDAGTRDEQNTPANLHLYSYDAPSTVHDAQDDDFEIWRILFREWVRVRLSGEFKNDNGLVEGSRASDMVDWYLLMYVKRGPDSKNVPDLDRTSVSVPRVHRNKGNGAAVPTLLSKEAETEGFTAKYEAKTRKWSLEGTASKTVSDEKANAPEGTTWSLSVDKKVKLVITQGKKPFETGDSFKFSVFKSERDDGKKFEINIGTTNILTKP